MTMGPQTRSPIPIEEASMKNPLPLILQFALAASCAVKTDNEATVFDEHVGKNVIRITGLEGNPRVIGTRSESTAETGTGRRYSAIETTVPNGPEIPPVPVPSEVTNVLLTLVDTASGGIKKIASSRGLKDIRLEDVPDGNYTVTAEAGDGFRPPPAKEIDVRGGRFESFELVFEKITDDGFSYYWESDEHGREFEYSAGGDVEPRIEILDESIDPPSASAARRLEDDYNIFADNGDKAWSFETTSRLLKTIDSIPHDKLTRRARFILTDREIDEDIEIEKRQGHWIVTLGIRAFDYAGGKLVKLDGKKGRFFSKRLFQCLIHFFTEGGRNDDAVEKILSEKFAVTTNVPDYRNLTGESGHNFQRFHNEELVQIINTFVQMPSGYHKIKGLRYLVRRKDGHPHPLYPEAAAVAWPRGPDEESYIEFMDSAFIGGSEDSIHRLILHEKTHFLWRNIFPEGLRQEWIEIGQWFENEEAASGWSTYDTTGFVSPYAHAKNPDEDMAETLSYYVLNPNKLLSLNPEKFRFVEKRIMNGYRYVSRIRDDLTFEVLNLFPDYDFPGKIRKVEVRALGDGYSDKDVTITIELTDKEGIRDEARYAFTRITSPEGTFKDLYLHPVAGDGHVLSGTLTIPNRAKGGYWNIQNITVTDSVGNRRMEGIVDFGFKLYINNLVEDTRPPRYAADSITIDAHEGTEGGRQTFALDIGWGVDEDVAMKRRHPVYANLISPDNPELYRITGYGSYDEESRRGRVRLVLTEFHPPGKYGVSFLSMQDRALNTGVQYFSDDPKHEAMKTVSISSRNPDYTKPSLDTERIFIRAVPIDPVSPDGSTKVDIVFYAKDDKSGLGIVHYKIVDPLGKVHFDYFQHENFYTRFFRGDPAVYKKYRIKTTLPKGSPPGRWGLLEIVLQDKAGNINTFNFLETIHFDLVH